LPSRRFAGTAIRTPTEKELALELERERRLIETHLAEANGELLSNET
jgi:hypothetical protein